MSNINLGERLAACAALVRQGAFLCDVGTDHAYLPIYLCERGIISRAVASDIKEGPLLRAKANIAAHRLTDKIETVLTAGLCSMEERGFSDIVIAGMGGLMIRDIIKAAPFLRSERISLVLQPMKNEDELRLWLSENGFCIEEELLALDTGKIYQIMRVVWDGEARSFTPTELLLGKGNIEARAERGELFIRLCEKQLEAYGKKVNGMKPDAKGYAQARRIYDEITALSKI